MLCKCKSIFFQFWKYTAVDVTTIPRVQSLHLIQFTAFYAPLYKFIVTQRSDCVDKRYQPKYKAGTLYL